MNGGRPIHYEPHPVSPERKAELIAQGVRIIDAIFAPADAEPVAEKPKRKGKADAEPVAGADGEQ
jgi:hypothetical protein